MRVPATETDDLELLRLRLELERARAAKAQAEPEEPKSSPGEMAAAATLGAVKALPIIGSNLEEFASKGFQTDPLRAELEGETIDANKLRELVQGLKERNPGSYATGNVASNIAQFFVPGSLLSKAPRAARFLAAPALGAVSAYAERPEGKMTKEQEHAARMNQAKWGALISGGLHGVSELPALLDFAKKAKNYAYDVIAPGGIAEKLDIGKESSDKIADVGEEVLPMLKGMFRTSRSNAQKIAKRAQEESSKVGQKIEQEISGIPGNISPTEITARTGLQVRGVPGEPIGQEEASRFLELEKATLASIKKVLKLPEEAQAKFRDIVRTNVNRAREEIEKTRPITAEELKSLWDRETEKQLLALGKVTPKEIYNLKKAAQSRVKAEYGKEQATRNMSSPEIRYSQAQARVAGDLISEAAGNAGGKKAEQSIRNLNKRYNALQTAESHAEKAAAKKDAGKSFVGPLLLGGGLAAMYGSGESEDPNVNDTLGLLGLVLGGSGLAAMPKNPVLRARVLNRLSKIKADPLKFGLIGGSYGKTVSPWSLMQQEESQ